MNIKFYLYNPKFIYNPVKLYSPIYMSFHACVYTSMSFLFHFSIQWAWHNFHVNAIFLQNRFL